MGEALPIKLEMLCETQELSMGPYLPPPDCNVEDPEKFPDFCAQSLAMGGSGGIGGRRRVTTRKRILAVAGRRRSSV